MIQTDPALESLLVHCRPQPRIALDTEADSLHCYFEKLCLVQIAVPGVVDLIDPLAGVGLQPLFDLCAEREIVLHGADYDLRLFRRAGMLKVGRLFDTMIAARLTGLREFSLAALLKRHFGVEVAKSSQKANWARRPLPERMTAYAMDDVRYLLELADQLTAELQRLGRVQWAEETCAKLVEVTRTARPRDEENIWRVSGGGLLCGREAALLRALWFWRDAEARHGDKPPFHIMQNREMIEAARRIATGERSDPRHLRGSRLERYQIAVEQALNLPESQWPKPPPRKALRRVPGHDARVAQLKGRRDRIAAELDLDASLIAPRATIETLADRPEEALNLLLPWQRQLLGF